MLALALAGCADARPPLEDCENRGRYWADCRAPDELTTSAEPVVACDLANGECRWFVGGRTARGHAVSDCPASDVCCHRVVTGAWAFSRWSPGGGVLERASSDLGFLPATPVDQDMPEGIAVVTDYAGAGEVRVWCSSGIAGFNCAGTAGYSRTVRRDGDSILITLHGWRERIEIDVWTRSDGERRARVFVQFQGPVDSVLSVRCGYWYGYEQPVAGTLHLGTDSLEDPEAIHGLLVGNDTAGVDLEIEF